MFLNNAFSIKEKIIKLKLTIMNHLTPFRNSVAIKDLLPFIDCIPINFYFQCSKIMQCTQGHVSKQNFGLSNIVFGGILFELIVRADNGIIRFLDDICVGCYGLGGAGRVVLYGRVSTLIDR